ncbi:MAG: (Fe-S)-binding protein [Bacteroidales bacterium]|jgi:Fe-S oxidoreductase|nr:(Fe-S)-binding protein [Bacteroidales bacterium]
MRYHPFVLPFSFGLAFLLIYTSIIWIRWINRLSENDKQLLRKNLFSFNTLAAIREVFMESLMHRKIFRKNVFLGFMHMSLAFGWFMLILIGNLESRTYTAGRINPPYFPIFFKFFRHDLAPLKKLEAYFGFWMDFFLLIVLLGLSLAFIKRAHSKVLGIKRTTKHIIIDKIALTSLWFIFPLRLLAEGFSAALYKTGNFLTSFMGDEILSGIASPTLYLQAWWAYSIALGIFFITLPFSRYMHIPTEILLIFLRRYGVKEKEQHSSFTKIEINACSRCGICIDACPITALPESSETQSAYFLREMRYDKPTNNQNESCLLCMRCEEACPVGIEITRIRENERKEYQLFASESYNYLTSPKNAAKGKVAFFAGCMGHLTPGVIKATLALFKAANVNYTFIDEEGSICCGRPLMQNGQTDAGISLRQINKDLILNSGAEILVSSCPICTREFIEHYVLGIPVFHHSQYILELAMSKKLSFRNNSTKIVYHDPCELSRGLNIIEEPRQLLRLAGELIHSPENSGKQQSLCCGGSLGNTNLSANQRKSIAENTLSGILSDKADIVATACPLCKKSLACSNKNIEILDIAQIMLEALIAPKFIPENTVESTKMESNLTYSPEINSIISE